MQLVGTIFVVGRTIGLLIALVVVAGVAVYGVFGADVWFWGCPSQEELERPRSADDIERAFADGDLPVRRVPWPPELRRARTYRGAVVYRHDRPGATLHVLVCRARCGLSRFQLRPGRPRAAHRFGWSGVNVGGWVTGTSGRAVADVRRQLDLVLDDVYDYPKPGSRCYVG